VRKNAKDDDSFIFILFLFNSGDKQVLWKFFFFLSQIRNKGYSRFRFQNKTVGGYEQKPYFFGEKK
jgi:hypothetical protein